MIRKLREHLGLKLIALATAIMIWSYAVSDRAGAPTRQVVADVVAVGEPPRGLDVELKTNSILVEVTGPRAQLDAIAEGSVKAIVDLSTARPGSRSLRVVRFVAPPEAPSVTFPPQSRTVEAVVHSVIRKRVRVSAEVSGTPPAGRRFSEPEVEPDWADVEGPREAVEKVALLLARPAVTPSGFAGQVAVDPVDRQGVTVPGVKVDPPTAHVRVEVVDLDQEKVLVVSPSLRGTPAAPYVIEAVSCNPPLVTVVGRPAEIAALEAARTVPINVEDLRSDTVRQVALDLPRGVRTRGNQITVEVTIRLKEATRAAPSG